MIERLRDPVACTSALQLATTALAAALAWVLAHSVLDEGGMLAARLLDVGIGVGVGLLVNLLVWPPLRDRGEGRRVLGQARESGRLNLRRATPERMRATKDFAGVLHRLGQAVAATRSSS